MHESIDTAPPLFLADATGMHLAGRRCSACGEVLLGAAGACGHCGDDAVAPLALSDAGQLWSYTVIRNRPPGDYCGPEPFRPYGVGLVELSEGVRVMARIDGDIDTLRIGVPVRFTVYERSAGNGSNVLSYCYRIVGKAGHG